MSAFHDRFEPDAKFPDWFHWTTRKPLFRQATVRYIPPDRDEPDPSDELEVTAFCENGNGFGSFHENAWTFITNNAASVEAALRRKLFVHHLKGYRGFLEECVPELDDYGADDWAVIKNEIDWEVPGAIDHLYELSGIGLIDDGLDECGYSYFDFNCGWDEEHGISVLMHKDRVLAAGGISEFCNRGAELIPHVQSIQRHDLDDGDLSLLEM